MSDPAREALCVREGAGCFALEDRGVVRVGGGDRLRWTNGMLTNEIATLAPGTERSGCHALLLTPQGRIVADLHVLACEQELLLELERSAVPDLLERLGRYVISDDVTLADASDAWQRFALEGPRAPELMARIAGALPELAPDCGCEIEIEGARAWVGAWGWSGEPAYQLFVPPDAASRVVARLRDAADFALVEGDAATLEVLRIEAGRPRFGSELGPDVLPAETGLVGSAVRLDKGCYTGQEIVARMASRGRASHQLVGLRLAEGPLPPTGAPLLADAKRVGELTSVCHSARVGAIGLGYVRVAHAAPDTPLSIGGTAAQVMALPFVRASS